MLTPMFIRDKGATPIRGSSNAKFAASLHLQVERLEAKAEKARQELNNFVAGLTREETNEYVRLTNPN